VLPSRGFGELDGNHATRSCLEIDFVDRAVFVNALLLFRKSKWAGSGGVWSLSTLDLHRAVGTIGVVGDY
jgi:hypothetical protein